MLQQPEPAAGRPPRQVQPGLWLFAPNRDTQGGSSWLLQGPEGPLLIDCPGVTQANLDFLAQQGADGTLVLTSREGHGRCRRIQEATGWPVVVQEQEAYLLPTVEGVEPFGSEHTLSAGLRLLWTPGPTPGSAVVHAQGTWGDLLFCGRLLMPVAPGALAPLRTTRCFHWRRQLASIGKLRDWLPPGSPAWIACGGGLGALRGEALVADGAALLAAIDLDALVDVMP
ncbi:MAG: MBL fold metallo-hydrolase [Cyanobacteriota bacterium]|nr:MBL fold metallo-hydrolase [Cyanobacteriota bacterium]